jgi:dethiobiotin synthetase
VSVFVTGTDTGVGKTSFSCWLLGRLRERGISCAGYKPICCGDRQDAELLLAAGSAGLTIEDINPIWLKMPAAPLTAAFAEKRTLDLALLRQGFVRLSEQVEFVIVEGVGGWIVPITESYFSSDLAIDLQLPVLVVVHNRLGCLNHTFLTVRNIEAAGLRCLGIILNDLGEAGDLSAETNADVLRRCLSVPVVEGFQPELLSLLL